MFSLSQLDAGMNILIERIIKFRQGKICDLKNGHRSTDARLQTGTKFMLILDKITF